MHRDSQRTKQAFTLVELMITVAIIGILSAAGLTLFQAQQVRSKRTEAMSNVEGIAKMARAYFGETGTYPAVAATWPAGPPTPPPVQWDAASSAAFGRIGFRAEGGVRYRYDLEADFECPCASAACFSAFAYSDLEGDGLIGSVAYIHRDTAGIECPSTFFGWVAPLDRSGNPVYDAAAYYLPGGGPGAPDDY
jgi:prepilin-type N-terminal cleavage/methylation domain-containing protein